MDHPDSMPEEPVAIMLSFILVSSVVGEQKY